MTELRRDSLSEDRYLPLDRGWDARVEGQHQDDNPYPTTNWKHYEWDKGWVLAEDTRKDKTDIH